MRNYAKNLVFKLFEKDELVGSNCISAKGNGHWKQINKCS